MEKGNLRRGKSHMQADGTCLKCGENWGLCVLDEWWERHWHIAKAQEGNLGLTL